MAREGPRRWVNTPVEFAHDDRLDARERMVLIVLAGRADDDGRCWPGYRHIAAAAGVSRNAVNALVKSLEEKGRVEVDRTRRNFHYRLLDWPRGE